MEIIVGLAASWVAVMIIHGLTRRTQKQHYDGEFVSPSYRARTARQCRSEFDANRLMSR